MMSRAPDPMCASLSFPHLDLTSVHVWFCELPRYADVQESFAALLSDEERTRAARFAFERDRQRFVLSHGVLRQLLARYTHIKAGEIQFITGRHGKPALAVPSVPSENIQFSLSHSGEYALVAVARGREVGVDVEVFKANMDCAKLAERFFAPREAQAMATLCGEPQQRMFYRLWTAKEAYFKGLGVGLSLGLERCEIVFDGESPHARVRLADSGTSDHAWQIQSLSLPDGLAGAVAASGGDWELHRYESTAYSLA
ncbi:MAG TPA: 4'-phosphopantetheinyl transferase superfamily protein [Nitrospira sp.]|nr:4'-phosphopantetheinyl transferase superfamily protein [Nitrospira sp.]